MKIITYNVNGLRAALSKGFTQWLEEEQPDVVCLQETKAQPDQIPTLEFEALGYRSYFFSAKKKGYSGVAILTRVEPDHVEYGMGIPAYDDEGRFIRADYGDLSVVSVYHPSGTTGDARQAFKMKWLEDFQYYIGELKKVVLFYGSTILPFVDHFPKNTELYRIMTTKPQELKKKENE